LNPGLFIRAYQMHSLSVECLRLVIKFAHSSDVLPKSRFVFHRGVEPMFCPVRLELPLILKTAQCFGRKSWLLSPVSPPHAPNRHGSNASTGQGAWYRPMPVPDTPVQP
jgi:hypothetical protein